MTPIDWKQAVFVAALAGGLFWGVAGGLIVASDGQPWAPAIVVAAAIFLVGMGLAVLRRSDSAQRRSRAVGVILAPLTGAVTVVTFVIGALFIQVLR